MPELQAETSLLSRPLQYAPPGRNFAARQAARLASIQLLQARNEFLRQIFATL